MASFSSSLPQAIPTPAASATVALPTDGERRHRRGQSPSEVSLTRTVATWTATTTLLPLAESTVRDASCHHVFLLKAPTRRQLLLWFCFFDLCWVVMTNRRDGL
ncbi:hypothetical protein DEO72_LG10g2108 [Vigna unguiculata]|uniref:Uncharacterized protein n=1 Tax=Vigna unguiculata TaxID=3917 RepID=A0A4D6NAW4_VIGUN|nr:hypothetical protein DEO72_LG10g2108 [Vigna unguiculata]